MILFSDAEFTDVVFIHITDDDHQRYQPYVTAQNTVQLAEFTDVVFIHTTDNDYQRYQPYVTAQNMYNLLSSPTWSLYTSPTTMQCHIRICGKIAR